MDIAQVKQTLEARRAWLDAKLHDYEHALDQTPNPDAEDRASEREGDEVLEGLGLSGLDEIRHIDAALARIAAGRYGECAGCGADIPKARLAALPFAVTCVRCAERA